mmetsp:Transcript_33197/g.86096  ORF Transcript_33197/g.86096 Transcript_33197/m.86096 type:complete len:233 (-) Transcript_33197:140-838(-)
MAPGGRPLPQPRAHQPRGRLRRRKRLPIFRDRQEAGHTAGAHCSAGTLPLPPNGPPLWHRQLRQELDPVGPVHWAGAAGAGGAQPAGLWARFPGRWLAGGVGRSGRDGSFVGPADRPQHPRAARPRQGHPLLRLPPQRLPRRHGRPGSQRARVGPAQARVPLQRASTPPPGVRGALRAQRRALLCDQRLRQAGEGVVLQDVWACVHPGGPREQGDERRRGARRQRPHRQRCL